MALTPQTSGNSTFGHSTVGIPRRVCYRYRMVKGDHWTPSRCRFVALLLSLILPLPATHAYQIDTDEVLKIASLVDDCDASFHTTRFPHLWQCWNSCRGFESERFSSFTSKLAETCPDYLLRTERRNDLAESTQSLHLFVTLMASSDEDPITRQRSEELFKEATMKHVMFSIDAFVETLDYRTALYAKNEDNGIGFFFSLEANPEN